MRELTLKETDAQGRAARVAALLAAGFDMDKEIHCEPTTLDGEPARRYTQDAD